MADEAHLRLEPSSGRGWFGGRRLIAAAPSAIVDGLSLAEAGRALEETFEGHHTGLTAVLARYDGGCALVRFEHVEEMPASAAAAVPAAPAPAPGVAGDARTPLLRAAEWDLSGRAFRRGVARTRARIAAGDVYVLNLTARLIGTLDVAPDAAFEALLARAASDMSAFVTGLPGATPWIASVSPERFVRVTRGPGDNRIAEVCPIKGTRPRGLTEEADHALARALMADEKERAEHVMIVDLERNDLGVVCAPGTVHVDPLYETVPTPYCHQLVSRVKGVLRPETGFAELLQATFPCGSVTGAPKRAAMRIIGELEVSPRVAYCGALLVAVPGEMDSSVLIRTLEGTPDASLARWGAGCGITYESDASAEHLELLLKASPVLGDSPPPVALRETMRVVHGVAPLLGRHLERLASGGCGPTTLSRVGEAVAGVLADADPRAAYARLGVTVTPDGEVAVGLSDHPSTLSVPGGPVVVPVEVREAADLPPQAAKPAARRFWDRAHHRAEADGAHQALLHLPDGTLVDGSTANVWLVSEGTLLTPPAPPAVAGVSRELVFDLADDLGIPVVERLLTLADYDAAQEVALSNAVGGFVAVRGGTGPLTARMAQAFEAVFSEGERREPG